MTAGAQLDSSVISWDVGNGDQNAPSADHLAHGSALGGVVTIAAQSVSVMLGVASTVVLARLLTPNDFGLVGMAAAVTGFALVARDLGLSTATVQRREITHSQVSALFWVNLAASLVCAAVIAAAAPFVASFYREPALTWIMVAMAGVFIPAGLCAQHRALLQRGMRFTVLATIDVAALALGIVVAVASAARGAGYWALVLMQLTTSVVAAAGTWILSDFRPRRPVRNVDIGGFLGFGRDLAAFNLLNYVGRSIDDVLIGRVWGSVQLGLYSRAYQLLMLPIHLITVPLGAVAIPLLSRLHGDRTLYRRTYLRILEKITAVTLPAAVFMIVISDWLILLVLGPGWMEAARIFAWLGVAALTQPVGTSTGWLFISQGRTREMRLWGVLSSAMILTSILAGIAWGAVGVAASYSLVGLLIRTPVLLWFVAREGPVRVGDFYRVSFPPALAAVGVLFALIAFRGFGADLNLFTRVILAGLLSVAVALLILLLVPGGRAILRDSRLIIQTARRRSAAHGSMDQDHAQLDTPNELFTSQDASPDPERVP